MATKLEIMALTKLRTELAGMHSPLLDLKTDSDEAAKTAARA
jgi:hypothetical protein